MNHFLKCGLYFFQMKASLLFNDLKTNRIKEKRLVLQQAMIAAQSLAGSAASADTSFSTQLPRIYRMRKNPGRKTSQGERLIHSSVCHPTENSQELAGVVCDIMWPRFQ